MQALAWIVRIAIVLVLVWFATRNSQPVTLHGLPEQSWQAPLVFVVLVAFVTGVVVGLLAWLPTVVRSRREISRLRRNPPPPPPPAPPAAAPVAPRPPEPVPGAGQDAHGI